MRLPTCQDGVENRDKVYSNLALTLGYVNPALNNLAQNTRLASSCSWVPKSQITHFNL